jgi:hypothetical protein
VRGGGAGARRHRPRRRRRVGLAGLGPLQARPARPWRAGSARLLEAAATWPRQALAGLVEAAAWPAGTARASPRPATSARSRPVALARQFEPLPPRPLQMASAGPRGVGWVEALVGWGAAGTPRASFASRWAGSASPGVGMGARAVPRAGLGVARTPGWTPTGCRREPAALRPPARSCDPPGGRRSAGGSMGALERRHRQQRDLPQSGSDLMLNDRHRRLRRASAGRLRGSTPDRDRPVQRLTGAAWEPQREGRHQPGRRLGSPLRRLAGLPGGRPVLRLRCRAWPRGAGVLPAGAGTGTGRRGRALVGPLTGPTARSQAKLNL